MFGLSVQELVVVGVVAILLFGKRLPEVARSLGQSYNQFRRGLQDIQSEMHRATDIRTTGTDSHATRDTYYNDDDYTKPTAPRLELPAPADATGPADANATEPATAEGDAQVVDSADRAS